MGKYMIKIYVRKQSFDRLFVFRTGIRRRRSVVKYMGVRVSQVKPLNSQAPQKN